jgi:hypothetical protein
MSLQALPEILQPLARTPSSGQLISLSLADRRYQTILENYGFLKEVQEYTRELRAYVTAKAEQSEAPRDHDLTTARVCQRKSEMITAILRAHGVKRAGSPAALREEIERLSGENERLRLLLRTNGVTFE